MKKFYALAAMLLCSAALFVSCDDDDNDRNYAKVGSTSYELTGAGASYSEIEDGINHFDLYLDEKSDKSGFRIDFYYLFCTADGNELKSGTYTYNDGITANLTHSGGSEYKEVDGEWIKLDQNMSFVVKNHGNDIYEFTWNTTDEDGLAVKGHFKGEVDFQPSED